MRLSQKNLPFLTLLVAMVLPLLSGCFDACKTDTYIYGTDLEPWFRDEQWLDGRWSRSENNVSVGVYINPPSSLELVGNRIAGK